MTDPLEFEKALDLLRFAEPSWKLDPLRQSSQNQQEIFTRPAEPRLNRFRFDDMTFANPISTDGAGDGGDNPNDPPTPLEAYEVSGNMNGVMFKGYLYGPPGQ